MDSFAVKQLHTETARDEPDTYDVCYHQKLNNLVASSGPPPLIGFTFQLAACQQLEMCFPCCWCKGAERPAKRCDISFVAGGVQEQAQDVLVQPLL